MQVLILFSLLVFMSVIVPMAVFNKKEVLNSRSSAIGAVLAWLGGAMVVGALGAFIWAILLWLGAVFTDMPGEYDDVLSILWQLVVGAGMVGASLLFLWNSVVQVWEEA